MSKIAQYLNEHLLGEVTTNDLIREKFSTDGSVLSIVPDMVIYPRTTSDLRKIARFSWQLAEKGHKLPITTRGGGSDQTGAAIGNGIIVDTVAHLNQIFEIDIKQRLVRAQPGVTFKSLNDALRLHGLYIPSYPASQAYSTIGGAIANNASGVLSGKYGSTSEWVSQLEIVLANGEILQTGRISKRELERKKGLQTFEGEIYRSVDNLIADNGPVLDSLAIDVRDNAGYNLVDVKRRDGSIDLMPLFAGSQGTLGIISEIILKAEPVPEPQLVGAFAFADFNAARDGIDTLRSFNPASMELIDGKIFVTAAQSGKRYKFYSEALDRMEVAAVVVVEFDDKGNHAKKKIAKRLAKTFENQQVYVTFESEADKAEDLRILTSVVSLSRISDRPELSSPSMLDGAYIPPERFEDFASAIAALETKHHVQLPIYGHATQHVYFTRPVFNFQKVTDRQKIFKLLADWSMLVSSYGGHLIGEAGEGRLKAVFAYKNMDEEVRALNTSIRGTFDPLDIMNTGVKQVIDLKELARELQQEYSVSDFAIYGAGD